MIGPIVILIWIGVIFHLFAKRMPATAVAWSVLGGYLFLPANFSIDLPAVPTLNKASISALCALLAATMLLTLPRIRAMPQGMILTGQVPRNRIVRLLLAVLLIGVVGTVFTNGDPLNYGGRPLSSLRVYDALSMTGNSLFALLPFLLARKYIAHPDAHKQLLIALALAGLIYTLPALYEVRMSPQLSRMIYGYFPHQWLQHVRAGGFRPVVFLHHGLWLAIFFCGSFLAALALWRSSTGKPRMQWMLAAAWLFMMLVLAKGMGALAIGLALGLVIVFLPVRLQVLTAAVLAGIVLTYPMLRGAGLVPVGQVISIAQSIDTARADSLAFRIENEDILLAKANERPLFGWGGWGRNRVYDETGQDISVTDGYWVMSIGTGGWIGYLAELGLLTLPLIFLALRWRKMALTPATAGIALALTANLLDLLPNATLTPVTWLLAGALAGRLELGRLPEPDAVAETDAVLPDRQTRYSRQTRRHPPHLVHPA
ncbi:hypothetical protein JJJ17_19655 [Paracoccus caeni]|uniref:O-antigen ligase like membrane protein n=1 Tax=Paracoccus caeni TaxID=657651 RepID=A0A934SN45_9RHOB|nr:hypothetical protein [Paracoccus caeni]MBK4218149.1 hypothetical protein [Paracoccus caeni]